LPEACCAAVAAEPTASTRQHRAGRLVERGEAFRLGQDTPADFVDRAGDIGNFKTELAGLIGNARHQARGARLVVRHSLSSARPFSATALRGGCIDAPGLTPR
jgi:hypothetical protein